MSHLIPVDGTRGEGGGQILRTALGLAAATGQGFEMTGIRAGRPRPGLRPQHLVAVRAAAMACTAKVGGGFEGSPDLRFEPGPPGPGDFRYEIATAGAATLVLQTVLAPLALAGALSRLEVTGGTHVPASPSCDYLARHWATAVARLGLEVKVHLVRAGFYPAGGGELRAEVSPWRESGVLQMEVRGALVAVRGLSGAGRVRGDVARRQRDAAQQRLWEERRIEAEWEVQDPVPAASPGSFLLIEAVFETGRAAFCFLGERRLPAERLGDRAARRLLRFLDEEGAVDPHLADQLALPMALRSGGRVTTCEVTSHLETVAEVLRLFGIPARTHGRRGGPGALEVERH